MSETREVLISVPQKGLLEQDSDKLAKEVSEMVLKTVSDCDWWTMLACYTEYKEGVSKDDRQKAKAMFYEEHASKLTLLQRQFELE